MLLATGATLLTVIAPTALALLLCNMDRICLSVAIIPIAQEFGWSAGLQASRTAVLPGGFSLAPWVNTYLVYAQGIVQSAFLYGYMATQLLGGTLADRFGGEVAQGSSEAPIVW